MNIHELFPSRYLKPSDLGEQEHPVTIARVHLEEVHVARTRRREAKPVLYFERARKGLILSAHKAHTIGALHGLETDAWPGRRITLYLERGVEAFGQRYDVVRVRPAAPLVAGGSEKQNAVLLDADEVEAGLAEDAEDEGDDCGSAGDAVPSDETATQVRRDCVALIEGFPEEDREELRRALDGLDEETELRRCRRWLQDERHEAKVEAERHEGRQAEPRRPDARRENADQSKPQTGRVHHE